jgi:hypothetical protein
MKLNLCVFLFVGTFSTGVLYAQETRLKTNSIDPNARVDKKKERPDKTRYMTIVKNNTKGILYGNKCFEEFTRSIGFVYAVQIKGNSGSLNGAARFFHNAGVKTGLIFTAWPWWKTRVNKKKKDCRKLSGDFVG